MRICTFSAILSLLGIALFGAEMAVDLSMAIENARSTRASKELANAFKQLQESKSPDSSKVIAELLASEDRLEVLDPDGIGTISKSSLYAVLASLATSKDSLESSRIFLSAAKSKAFSPFDSGSGPQLGRSRAWLAAVGLIRTPTEEVIAVIEEQARENGCHRLEAIRALGRIGNRDAIGALEAATGESPVFRANASIWVQEFRDRPEVFQYMAASYRACGEHAKWVLDAILTRDVVVPQEPGGEAKKVPTYESIPNEHAREYVEVLDGLLGSKESSEMPDAAKSRLKQIRDLMTKKAEDYRKPEKKLPPPPTPEPKDGKQSTPTTDDKKGEGK